MTSNFNLLEEQLQSADPTREKLEFAGHLVNYLEPIRISI
jgi:hypothetical protein